MNSLAEDDRRPLTFGGRLAALRRLRGLTQEQLGEGLGPDGSDLGKGAISSWEVDRTQPSVTQLALICRRLGVSADELLPCVPAPTTQP